MATAERAARLRDRMVGRLEQDGALSDPHWLAAFRQVPRHVFLRRWFEPDGRYWRAVDHTTPGWLESVYSDRVLVTQLDADPNRWQRALRARVTGTPTSSSSMPGIMAVMLEALQVRDGHRVLEIGTGTGYNAALLCHRLGDRLVSTVDVDSTVLVQARDHLAVAGYHPDCAVADGALGRPARAPYDRVLATCAVSEIPLPWLEQTVPGGQIVTTLNRPIGAGLVRLTAVSGSTAQGSVLPQDGRFMPLRAHRTAARVPAERSGVRRSTLVSRSEALQPTSPFEFFAGLALPRVWVLPVGKHTVVVHPDGSFAVPEERTVFEGGPRKLWTEVEAAHDRWLSLGSPDRARFGVTVDNTGQFFWLDHPDGPRWPL